MSALYFCACRVVHASSRAKLWAAAQNQSGELKIQVPPKYDSAPAFPEGKAWMLGMCHDSASYP